MTQKERYLVLDALYNLRGACSYDDMNKGAGLVRRALQSLEDAF